MKYAGVEVDLVGVTILVKDIFGLVSLLGCEDGISLRGSDRQRPCNRRQLILVDKRWVGDIADVDAIFEVADNVLHRVAKTRQ